MGSIRQREGIWYFRYYDPTGKQREISLHTKSQAVAERLEKRFNDELSLGTDPDLIINATLSYVIEQYFDFITPQKTPQIIYNYRTQANRLNEWFDVEIRKLKPFHVLRLIDRLSKEYAQETVRKTIVFLKRILRWAVAEGYIQENPAEDITVSRPKKKRRFHYFTKDELSQIFMIARKEYPDYAPIFMFLYYTGLRRSELVSMKWVDIDFKEKVLHVQDSKTKHGVRIIPLCSEAVEILEKLPRENEWVFTSNLTGGPVRGDTITRNFTRVLKKAGLKKEGVGVHILRHTFASHLAMAGVSLDVIRDLLGHSSVIITEIYAHLSPEQHKAAIEKLPEVNRD